MKLKEFEENNKANPAFNTRKFKRYWRSMLHHYENLRFRTPLSEARDEKRKTTIFKFPTQLLQLPAEEKEGYIGGVRSTVHK